MAALSGKDIILISTEHWGDVYVSKHYYADYLSRDNRVWYINPVSLPWKPGNLFEIPITTTEVKPGLTVVSYGNPFPRLNKQPLWLQKWAFRRIATQLKKTLGIKGPDIVWSFDFGRFLDLKAFKAETAILHVVELFDDAWFEEYAPYGTKAVQSADLVVSIARLISDRLIAYRSDVITITHGADVEGFENALRASTPIELPGRNPIKAGFLGNFQKSFDFELLHVLAQRYVHVDFVLIGPYKGDSNLGGLRDDVRKGIAALQAMPNVHFVGKVPSATVMQYLSKLDINLVLYKDAYSGVHCNPHKMMSYLYAGKVVMTSYIDEYRDRPNLVKMVKLNSEFPALFDEVVSNLDRFNSPANQALRRQFAMDNTYPKQIERVSAYLP